MRLKTSETTRFSSLQLESGETVSPLEIAYETWGTLNAGKSNAILLCHGYTNHPHASGDSDGWWQALIGPGLAIDTNRYFVICSNMLGSAFGSSGPASIDTRTKRPYGPDFPEFSTADIIAAQKRLIDDMDICQLAAVVGYSYGGSLAFRWGHTWPERTRSLVVVASGIVGRGDQAMLDALRRRFESCAGWNGGHYYDADPTGSVSDMLATIRQETLRSYGVDRTLEDRLGSREDAGTALADMATRWAGMFDANSLIELRRAAIQYDGRPHVGHIRAPLLYVLSRTDRAYPPTLATPTMALLSDAGVTAEYVEIDSKYGHHAPAADWQKWAPALKDFLDRTAAPGICRGMKT